MSSFYGDVGIWNISIDADIKDENIKSRLLKYKNIVNYIESDIGTGNLCNIEALERIGSESTMGQVYLYKAPEKYSNLIAVKILPIINSRSKSINEKEIKLAREVSNLVLENKSKYFPLVYYDTFCSSTYYYEHNTSKFSTQSLNYQQYEYVRNRIIDSISSFLSSKKFTTKEESDENSLIISNLENYIFELYKSGGKIGDNTITKLFGNVISDIGIDDEIRDITNNIPTNISSNLLFSELAHMDLKNYLNKYIEIEILNKIVIQVFKGIRDLQMLCSIVHNDLHLGNVLLLFKPYSISDGSNKVNILIHDFGRSIKVQNSDGTNKKLSNIQRKTDILTFIKEIRNYINIFYENDEYNNINKKIEMIIENLDENTNDFPILDVIDLWKQE